MDSGIYCIENIINGKRYIGKGINVNRRMWQDHIKSLAVKSAIEKYEDGIIRYIVEYCEPEKMIFWEQYYIREWNTKSPNGYNLTDGGEGVLNPSNETRKRMRESQIGKVISIDTRKKMSVARSGKKHPLYGKHGEDNPNYGSHRTNITKEKMSIAQQGEKNHNYKKFGVENALFGRKSSNASSHYFGVYIRCCDEDNIYWLFCLNENGKTKGSKTYKTELEAARAYNEYVIEHGLPNPLNVLDEDN